MSERRNSAFVSIRAEGALLPAELLGRIARFDKSLGEFDGTSYRLSSDERLSDVIQRAWTRLRSVWVSYRSALERTPASESATTLTREKWLLPLFSELGFGRLAPARSIVCGDKSFPVSHGWGNHVALHLVGARVSLDQRTAGVAGAARTTPHGMVQDLLNRSADHLWAVVSNGNQLRLLRDNASLTRQAFVEFDLVAMFDGEAYSDFVPFFLLLHVSRFGDERPDDCALERWATAAKEQGTRALDRLRDGVERAIKALGGGFVGAPQNSRLKDRLRSGALPTQDYYRQVLRLVYRLLFLFVAEDRNLLLLPGANESTRLRYDRWYSTARLRRLASRRGGTPHVDLWRQFRLVCQLLGRDEGGPSLGLPALGSFLFSDSAAPDLDVSELPNRDFLDALRALTLVEEDGVRRTVDWRNLGAEELGSVYESLLELHPQIHLEAGTFELRIAGGNERKTTGSYYTPDSLIQCLLDSALDPVLNDACAKPKPEAAILALRVCDPACGSGHFLIAAAHRIAKRLAAARTGDDEPPPDAIRRALRDVIGRCLHGVDLNEMAVELCKVNLWMEALEPGRPLSFLDAKILHGNALLGTTPALIAKGIPDEAFEPIAGDDRAVARGIKKQNKAEHGGAADLFGLIAADATAEYGSVAASSAEVTSISDGSISGVRSKEARWKSLQDSSDFRHAVHVADAWCAAFVWPMHDGAPPAPTISVLDNIQSRKPVQTSTTREIHRIARDYQFLHWHLAFPEVFRIPSLTQKAENPTSGWSGGFDVVLGNPPWDQVQLDPREFFALSDPKIANADTMASRERMIQGLAAADAPLHASYLAALRRMEGFQGFVHSSGRFPHTSNGRLNTAPLFAEAIRDLIGLTGRAGFVVPTGIATDSFNQYFFQSLIDRSSLISLFDFENSLPLFPSVDRRFKFCLVTLASRRGIDIAEAEFAFFLRTPTDLRERERRFALTAEDFVLLNPNTRTCPIFRNRRDAEITKAIYRRVPILVRHGPPEVNPWGFSAVLMFMMNTDSKYFRVRKELERDGFRLEGNTFTRGSDRYVPLYEAKMIHHFNHRFGDFGDQPDDSESSSLQDISLDRLADPSYVVLPRYWVPSSEVDARLANRWTKDWMLCFRGITNATNERTIISAVLPRVALGNSAPLLIPSATARDPRQTTGLLACLSSFAHDFCARFKVAGSNLNFFIVEQLPVLPPSAFDVLARSLLGDYDRGRDGDSVPREPSLGIPAESSQLSGRSENGESTTAAGMTMLDWIVPRVIELVYTSNDMAPFARDCGINGPPFKWDEERRFHLRCELDAAFFRLYQLPREDVSYILDTFPIVRRHDEKLFGTFRTKSTILSLFDKMSQ